MRLLIITAAVAALAFPAFAQQQQAPQRSPSGQPRQAPQAAPPQRGAPPPQQQAQPEPPAPLPGMFACRTEQEICYVGIALPGNQISVLFTNNEQADGIDTKPQAVVGADLAQFAGRVVMMIGTYNAQSGISGAEVIDSAGPLVSFAIKSQLSNSGGGDDEEEPAPAPAPKAAPKRR